MIATPDRKIQLTSLDRDAVFRTLRFGLLLLGLCLPAVLPSVAAFGSESDASCEDVTECIGCTEIGRLRSRRSDQRSRSDCCACATRCPVVSAQWPVGQAVDGHRITNELLAPMRC